MINFATEKTKATRIFDKRSQSALVVGVYSDYHVYFVKEIMDFHLHS